ncbi:hypothetical protein SAMN05421781_0016 [Marinococcus luteus]|uniref:DUF3967 domain-containing protein n=1 Tax=Marinococcus luteus TaxID=1122204 RepID=A0A1H2YAL5_9BACI|nr:hypothetical protein [Marinococcus luteus]SDX01878.1 hypothetical protein SAMN05421781_0016 [Marinococcus luteus]
MEMQYRMTDLADKLGLKESTARKYFLLVEKKGHFFKRSNQGHILFTEDDVSLFQEIIRLKNHPDHSIESAIDYIINVENNGYHESHGGESGLVPYQQFEDLNHNIDELKAILRQQQKESQRALQEQQRKHEEQLEAAEKREQILTDYLVEQKKDMDEIKEKLDKKGFWARLFGG